MLLLSALTLVVAWAPSQELPDLKTILQRPPLATIPPLSPQVEADLLRKAGFGTRKLLEIVPPMTVMRPYYMKERIFIDLAGGSNSLLNAMWITASRSDHLTVFANGNTPFLNNFLFTYNVEAQSPVTINIDVVPASGTVVRTTTTVTAPTAIGVGVPSGTRQVDVKVIAQNGVGGTLQIDSIGIKDFGP